MENIKVREICNKEYVYNIEIDYNDVREEVCYVVGVFNNKCDVGVILIMDDEGNERRELCMNVGEYEVLDYEMDEDSKIYIGDEEIYKYLIK